MAQRRTKTGLPVRGEPLSAFEPSEATGALGHSHVRRLENTGSIPQRDSCGSGPRPHLLDSRRGYPPLANTVDGGFNRRPDLNLGDRWIMSGKPAYRATKQQFPIRTAIYETAIPIALGRFRSLNCIVTA